MQNQRLVTLVFLIGGIAVGVLVRSATRALLPLAGLEDPLLLDLAPMSLLLGVGSAVVGFFGLMRHERSSTFVDSVIGELSVVTWPSREETMNNTGVVVGATVFFAALLAVYDFAWARLSELVLYSQG